MNTQNTWEKPMINHIVHYTSKKKWKKIKKSEFLEPRSEPDNFCEVPEGVKSTVKWDSYIVGLQKAVDKGWHEYGLMYDLMRHTKGEVALIVPIKDYDGAFVREHAHVSPKVFIEQYGKGMWKEWTSGKINGSDPRVQEAYKKYMESSVPLAKYSGGYAVPEIWIPQKIPINDLEPIGYCDEDAELGKKPELTERFCGAIKKYLRF